ncbi:hypothetical protein TIFTF001_027734 [Ficus carica]|uniref:Uncharacterized protein n=1 Tax=Ficus carica TaxID=3494 RepID=A0AA88IZ20_FICCA|nr:hypothetical protein TIFTF001_027734 [Ficus carica]
MHMLNLDLPLVDLTGWIISVELLEARALGLQSVPRDFEFLASV